jgi:hemolysin III
MASGLREQENVHDKPSWRGVLHQWAAWFALGAGSVLVAMAPTTRSAIASAIYALTLAALFGVSAAYHRGQWSPRSRARMRRADHASIFLLIAGSYTPVALLGLDGSPGRIVTVAVWCGAAVGVLQSLFWADAPKVVQAGLAVAVGWTIIPYLAELRRALSAAQLGLVVAGGIAYTVGALVFALGKPDPWPRTFGYHEVFHALTLVGAGMHLAAIVQIVRAMEG